MKKWIYAIIGLPHIIIYLLYRNKDKRIDMDLATYNDGRIGVDAFINTLSINEYRNVFYFRIPWILRVFLNIFLRRVPDCKLQCAHCGGALNVHHGWGTIVLADRIGENFSVYQNVTVGYGKDGKPSIGNHVSIYSGAVVFGNITIGNHVRIAANTVVRTDIPDGSLVYGNPAVIVNQK